jgi:hypothetical protein
MEQRHCCPQIKQLGMQMALDAAHFHFWYFRANITVKLKFSFQLVRKTAPAGFWHGLCIAASTRGQCYTFGIAQCGA